MYANFYVQTFSHLFSVTSPLIAIHEHYITYAIDGTRPTRPKPVRSHSAASTTHVMRNNAMRNTKAEEWYGYSARSESSSAGDSSWNHHTHSTVNLGNTPHKDAGEFRPSEKGRRFDSSHYIFNSKHGFCQVWPHMQVFCRIQVCQQAEAGLQIVTKCTPVRKRS